jgi:hypothetical protein
MATLSTLASQIAESFDRGNDILFLERLKDLIIQTRNTFVHREADKYGINERYIQPYVAELILVNASIDPNTPSRYTILRTKYKIPAPIRHQSDTPFVFVGKTDRMVPFRHIKPYIMMFSRHLRLIGGGIAYIYTNEYIYIWNNTKLEWLLVDAVYERLDVTRDSDDPTGLCYKDDMEFPLAGDMLNAVIEEVTRLVRNTSDAQSKNPVTTRDIE